MWIFHLPLKTSMASLTAIKCAVQAGVKVPFALISFASVSAII
jgi:hypothetical protein